MLATPATPDRARFTLDDLGTPVVASVMSRQDDRITVAQPLPFLKLKNGIRDASGRLGRISAVRVDLADDDTPSLVFDVVYEIHEDDTRPLRRPRRDPTLSFERPSVAPPRVIALSDPPPAARGEAVRAPGTRKPAWLTALDAWLDPRIDALSRWLTSRDASRT